MSEIRILVVDDRSEVRQSLQMLLEKDQRFSVVAALSSCQDALRLIKLEAPQAVTVRWPMADGSSASCVRQVSGKFATPVVAVVDADFARNEALALRQGAVSAFPALPSPLHQDYARRCQAFLDHVAAMSKVHIIRRKLDFRPVGENLCSSALAEPRMTQVMGVGIVASTGGPAAVCEILRKLPAEFPAPVLLVQHITSEFSESFVEWLDKNVPMRVQMAENEELTAAGSIYVAPPDFHLHWENRRTWLRKGERECWQRPSGNVLFRSLAESGLNTIGVILTGLGEDGAQGLLSLRQSGSHTIAQDRASCVVYGMPKAAVRIGAVDEELALDMIGPRILDLARRPGVL
ncbi:chemotaxis response regulator protein-glutamate methylesterase [bacterium]|nr:chemotaxis response regulator protein-glutamate methylesterase [bacterium]